MNPFYGVKLLAAARRAEDLVAEINRLRSQLAEAREAHAFDKRAHRDTVAVLTTSWERDAAKIRAERYSLQKERNDYRRMWIKTLSQADRAEVDAKQARDQLIAEIEAIASDMDRWGVPASVRAVDPICADIHAWKGRLRAITTAPEATITRCTSCDHTIDMHQSDGCWYTVETGVGNLVCVCSVPAQEQ